MYLCKLFKNKIRFPIEKKVVLVMKFSLHFHKQIYWTVTYPSPKRNILMNNKSVFTEYLDE
jgi:hypothetical protein